MIKPKSNPKPFGRKEKMDLGKIGNKQRAWAGKDCPGPLRLRAGLGYGWL